jgi:hypothetical protein
VTVCTEPSEIVMYWPTVLVSADQACAESSIDRACPVPTALLSQTLEYDRALSAGFTTSTSAPKKGGCTHIIRLERQVGTCEQWVIHTRQNNKLRSERARLIWQALGMTAKT